MLGIASALKKIVNDKTGECAWCAKGRNFRVLQTESKAGY